MDSSTIEIASPRASLTRAEWREVYRHFRCVRRRAVRWLYRAAGVRRGYIAGPFDLAVLIGLDRSDEEFVSKQGALMFMGGEPTLRIPTSEVRPMPLHVMHWGLAAWAVYVLAERRASRYEVDQDANGVVTGARRVDRPGSWHFNRHMGPASQVLPDWEHRLTHFIADALDADAEEYYRADVDELQRRRRLNRLGRWPAKVAGDTAEAAQ